MRVLYKHATLILVGKVGLEPTTNPLWAGRSYHWATCLHLAPVFSSVEKHSLFFAFGFYDTVEVESMILYLTIDQSRVGPQYRLGSFELFRFWVVGTGSDLPRFEREGETISFR